jgi:hypothetical protein
MFATWSPEHSYSKHENPVIQRTYNLSVLNANQTDRWSSAANCLVLMCIYKTTPHYLQCVFTKHHHITSSGTSSYSIS